MEDRNVQAEQEINCQFYDQIQSISHEDWNRWFTCHILIKKNIWMDIIKTILGYPLMAVPEMLRKWKIAITLVG